MSPVRAPKVGDQKEIGKWNSAWLDGVILVNNPRDPSGTTHPIAIYFQDRSYIQLLNKHSRVAAPPRSHGGFAGSLHRLRDQILSWSFILNPFACGICMLVSVPPRRFDFKAHLLSFYLQLNEMSQ